jgi:hypothetical protein
MVLKSKIKKTKRLHQIYQDWLKITEMDKQSGNQMRHDMETAHKKLRMPKHYPTMFDQPMAGKWYYEYRNDKGGYVGLAKLQDHNFTFMGGDRKWMWETCTANEGLELRRFPTQKQAEIAIYKFLGPKKK